MRKPDPARDILGYLFPGRRRTRTEIAEALQIRKSTVGVVCARLLEQGFLQTEEQARRNNKLWINPRAYMAIGVQHKVDELKMVLLDAGLNVRARESYPLDSVTDEARVERILQGLNGLLEVRGPAEGRVIGLGFSDFIPHDIGTGMKTKSIWIPGWGDINIKAIIEQSLNLSTEVMRCTDAFSFAEHVFGDCRDADAFITVQLDEGIGISVYKDNKYLKGSTDIFGELGHVVYKEDGDICKCGNRGCLETIAGIEAIIKKVKENAEKGAYFRTEGALGDITLEDVITNAREGNKLALLSINEAAKALGNTLAVVVNVLGISRVVLYGRLVKAGKILERQVTNSIQQHCIYPLNQDTKVCLSSLDEFGSAMGAAFAVMHAYFRQEALRI
ncbi:MAG: ROK family transcriptional regulator [Spirochaetales bacterium]|nr:ROK family transcriptional regulator [Spirochaetales bacterium]